VGGGVLTAGSVVPGRPLAKTPQSGLLFTICHSSCGVPAYRYFELNSVGRRLSIFMALSSDPKGIPESKPGGTVEPRRFPWLLVVIVLLVIGGIAFLVVYRRQHATTAGGQGKGKGKGGNMPIAAVIGVVTQKDFSIYLDGLGTVQAFNSVTLRSRVDGELQKVAFEEGQDVHAGDLLAQIDPASFQTQVQQAQAKQAQDEAQVENARIDLNRNEKLLASKIIAQEVYDTAKALVNQLSAAVKADQAAVSNAQVQLGYTKISAPIDGRTGLRLVDVGNMIRSGDSSNGIVTLTQVRPISVVFTLPEQSLRDIQQGQSQSQMLVRALDRDNVTLLDEGKLTVIDNQIDTTTGTIRLKATFPNANLKLWPGQFINARLLLSVRTNAVVVPASVVQRGPEGSYAFVVDDDSKVKMATIKVGKIDQGQALIESGLTGGERVVVDGQYKLQPGSKVKEAEAAGATNTEASPKPENSKKGGKGGGKKKGS
jgi:multidrug efflux system membrane fusion protein